MIAVSSHTVCVC